MKRILCLIFCLVLFFAVPASALLFDNIQGKWKLSNGIYTDVSGNGNTLTASGSPTSVAGHADHPTNATNFVTASSQYLYVNDASQTGLDITGNLSISAWIKLTGHATNLIIVSKENTNDNAYDFWVQSTGVLNFRYTNSGTTYTTCTGATDLGLDTWYHVAAVYNGTDMRIYIDGALDSNGASNPKAYTSGGRNSAGPFAIGALYGGSYSLFFNGVIDDVCVWSRNLSAAEVGEMYALPEEFYAYVVSGTIKDKNGTTVDCSTYNTRVNVYSKNNTAAIPISTTLCTAAGGTWALGVPDAVKYLVTFEFEGAYAPTSETDIAGAEFMTGVLP